jgi:hypothetical protein
MQTMSDRMTMQREWQSAAPVAAGAAPKLMAAPAKMRRERAISLAFGPAFAASKYVYYVLGRPVVIFKVTHETPTEQEEIPYLASVFSPAVILEMVGKTAALPPEVDRKEAVWHCWHDALLPFMSSPQFPPDTLFLVCEGDLRLAEVHENVCRAYEASLTPQRWRGPPHKLPPKAATDTEDPASSEQPRRGEDPWQQEDSEDKDKWWNAPAPASAPADRTDRGRNPLLEQIVAICTIATREGHGDFIWLTWTPTKNSPHGDGVYHPNVGCTCIALSKAGASNLYTIMDSEKPKPRHFDNYLSSILADGELAAGATRRLRDRACYLWDPMGGFADHTSGCDMRGPLVRSCHWCDVQDWPLRLTGSKRSARWLVRFGRAGKNVSRKLCVLPDNVAGIQWQTYLPAKFRGSDGQVDMKKMHLALGGADDEADDTEPSDTEPVQTDVPVSEQPSAPEQPGISSSTVLCGPALPEDHRVDLEPDVDDLPSVISVEEVPDPEAAETPDPAAYFSAPQHQEETGESKKRKQYLHPVDPQGAEGEVWRTRHRRRTRRKNIMAYHQFRNFTSFEEHRSCVCSIVHIENAPTSHA